MFPGAPPRLATVVVGLALGWPRPGTPQPLAEVTDASGVVFTHDPGDLSRFPLPAIMGAGAALFDADGDGDLDLYLIQSGPLPEDRAGIPPERLPRNRLFRREPTGVWRESDGLGDPGYGTGVAVGDVDGDGDLDVFVQNHGPDALYLNQRGEFEQAPVADFGARWSSSAAFCDYDADGDLDLYVGGYLRNDPGRECVSASGEPDFCAPESLPYERDALFRNRGGGVFEDVSQTAGIADERRPALGVLCHDFTGDGRLDFYVANDGEPNLLWEQDDHGRFADAALLLGVALNSQGRPEASMGVALGDVDGDRDLDLFMTHLRSQTNTLYRNRGSGFLDDTPVSGLGLPSLPRTGFGTRFLDLEHDGDLDLVIVNGAVAREAGVAPDSGLAAYAEPAQVFLGDGAGGFEPLEVEGFTTAPWVGRGLATGDWDRDGDLDLVVTSVGNRVRFFENRAAKRGGFVVVEPRESGSPSPGAIVTLDLGDRSLVRGLNPEAGYLTSSEPVVHFGVPAGVPVTGLRIRWPDGTEESFPPPAPNTRRILDRTRGRGPPQSG